MDYLEGGGFLRQYNLYLIEIGLLPIKFEDDFRNPDT